MARLGLYLIGARGNVAGCTLTGALALTRNLAQPTGLVTALPHFDGCDLARWQDIALGGCDTGRSAGHTRQDSPLLAKIRSLAADAHMFPAATVEAVAAEVAAYDAAIDEGIAYDPALLPAEGYRAALERIAGNIERFRARVRAERIVVINLSSTEATLSVDGRHGEPQSFRRALDTEMPGSATQSMLYAWAAFSCGAAFVNFTPSQANEVPALDRLARERGLPHAGKDGKTGETLLKTVLGPMFAARNLKVLSWLGNNYLGNGDGRTLADTRARATKLASKDQALRTILGPDTHLSTDIGYAPSLGDWKTAWDFVHFEGFLGAHMSLQLTWQGCDSALAAPLVLDLARLTERAWRNGERGALGWLASFFKSPQGEHEQAFAAQFAKLLDHAKTWQ